MKPRAAHSQTIDMFATAPPASVAKPAVLKIRAPSPEDTDALVRRAPPLWYAVVFKESPAEEALQHLCLHAQRFTPYVSFEAPNALLLEIRGSVKLFGSLATLHADIDACWQGLNLEAHSASAPSTLAALWLARAGASVHFEDAALLAGQLAQLPINCTGWDEEYMYTLRALGVMRLGEVLRLPRAGLARRLSPRVVRDLDIATGRQFAPRRAFVRRERFFERCDFESEIEHTAYLLQALEPVLERCARFLRQRQAGVERLKLRLRHRSQPLSIVQFGLASITSERCRLSDVLTQKLTDLQLQAPVRGMELISGPLRALSASSLDAFAGLRGGQDSAPQLVERLRARLGEAAVYGLSLIAEHRPEAAWQRVHELTWSVGDPAASSTVLKTMDLGMPRPVWLLQAPLPWQTPKILQGPERIESGWWDGKGVARDYYVANSQGAKLWVFQERHSRRWYLHGVFA